MPFINALPVPAFAVDAQGKVTAWNAAMTELTGRQATQALGKKAWSSLLAKRGSTPIDDALSNGEEVDVSFRITHGVSGEAIDARFQAKPLLDPEDEEPRGAVAVVSPASAGANLSRAALEASPRAELILDRELVITYANPAAKRLLEEHASALRASRPRLSVEQLVGSSVDVLLEDPARDRRGLADPASPPRRLNLSAGGASLELLVSALRDDAGAPIGTLIELSDATAARDRERESAAHQQVRSALDKTQAIIEFSLDGTITHANALFLEAVGYTLDEVRGKHHRIFMLPADAHKPEYRAFWEALARGEPQSGVFRRVTKEGDEIWLQASYNPIFDADGKPFKVVKFATDITRERLRNADFQGQMQAVSKAQAVIEFELDGTIITANDNFLAALGYRLDEIQGRPHRSFVDTVQAQSAEYRGFWEALRRGEYQTGVFRRIGKGGKEVWIQASYNPIFDLDGKPFKVVKYATDVTAQTLKQRQDERDAAEYAEEVGRVIRACKEGHLDQRGNVAQLSALHAPMMAGINEVIDALVRPVQEASTVLAALAQQDLTARVVGDYQGDHAIIKENLNATGESLERALGQVLEATSQLKSASSQISSGSQSLAQATNEQASALEEVSSTVEELSAMTDQNAANATQAKKLSDGAKGSANQGKAAMDQLSGAIERIKGSSDQTAKIVKTIDEIAFQTNLLALNAAVEAARAGDAGKGFAVVAEEVRSLAQRSAQAAKNTAELIEGSVKNAETGVRLGDEVARQLSEIVTGSEKVNDIVAEIASASAEQAKGISQINQALANVNQITQSNAANSEQSAAAAEQLSAQAEQLASLVEQFRIGETTAAVIAAHQPAAPPPRSRGTPPAPTVRSARHAPPATASARNPRPASRVIPLTEEDLEKF